MSIKPGVRLGQRYQLLSPIATGGMGQVWRAEDTTLHRVVAAKILRSEFTGDETFVKRFRAEAQNTAALSHPNIASVYDYGEQVHDSERLAYLVMELVEGEPLVDILARERRISAERTLDYLQQTASGLAAAHREGMVHRDVKPGNLILRPDGVLKITDFGIARAANAAALTEQGTVVGTAQYLAPEQAEGKPARPASDIYALGVVGYECLAGFRPFDGDNSVAIALSQIRDTPRPLPPDVPPNVRRLIELTMTKNPDARYRDGDEYVAAVRKVRAGQPPVPPPYRPTAAPAAPVQLPGTPRPPGHPAGPGGPRPGAAGRLGMPASPGPMRGGPAMHGTAAIQRSASGPPAATGAGRPGGLAGPGGPGGPGTALPRGAASSSGGSGTFVPGGATPTTDSASAHKRWWWILAIAALLVAVTLVIVFVVLSDDDDGPPDGQSPPSSTSASTITDEPTKSGDAPSANPDADNDSGAPDILDDDAPDGAVVLDSTKIIGRQLAYVTEGLAKLDLDVQVAVLYDGDPTAGEPGSVTSGEPFDVPIEAEEVITLHVVPQPSDGPSS